MQALDDLSFFVQLVQKGSLSALARDLRVTPSAVSIRLTKLEKNLQARLLNRSTRTLSLTYEGELYFNRGKQLLAEIAQMHQQISGACTHPQGLLRINAPPAFGRYVIAPMISEFVRQYPDVEVQLALSDSPMDLVANAFDVAIRFGIPADSLLIARKIAPCRNILCASPAYLAQAGWPTSPRDLLKHQCIVQKDGDQAVQWQFNRGSEQETIRIKGALSSNDGEILLTWGLLGHGILTRRDWYIKRMIRAGLLQQVLPDWSLPEESIYAAYPERTQLPAKVSVFIDFAVRQLAAIRQESLD